MYEGFGKDLIDHLLSFSMLVGVIGILIMVGLVILAVTPIFKDLDEHFKRLNNE